MTISDTPLTASAFLGTFGINTHLNYTDGAYFNTRQVLADLQYLGVRQVRDTLSNSAGQSLSSYKLLADQGITFDFIAGASSAAAITEKLALIDRFAAMAPGAVSAIEGLNEFNNWPVTWSNGDTGLQAGLDAQRTLYAAVHGDAALQGVSVYYLTGYGSGSAAGPDPVAAGLADYDNQHPYPIWGLAPGAWVSRASLTNTASSTTPAVFTETGYNTNTGAKGRMAASASSCRPSTRWICCSTMPNRASPRPSFTNCSTPTRRAPARVTTASGCSTTRVPPSSRRPPCTM